MKKLITIIIVLLSLTDLQAQQDPHFTHYMFNTLAVNPAYAGSRDAMTVTLLYRNQWLGFDGAPVTKTLTAHSPAFKDKVGLGLSVIDDRIGPTSNYSLFGDFAYMIPVGESRKAKLAFGLKGGVNFMKIGLANLEVIDDLDQEFYNNVTSQLLPNFGFGVYYYSELFYVGASVPRILENKFDGKNVDRIGSQIRHYSLILGAMVKLNSNVKMKPTLLTKLAEGTPPEVDLSVLFYLANDKFWIGPAYRTGLKNAEAVSGIAGVQLFDHLSIGYSFDYSFVNETFKYNSGSHEIMLRYDFIKKDRTIRVVSPRYF